MIAILLSFSSIYRFDYLRNLLTASLNVRIVLGMLRFRFVLVSAILFIQTISTGIHAQNPEQKEVIESEQVWISLNNTYRISDRISLLSDFHLRRTDFLENPSFYFMRFGCRYHPNKEGIQFSGGYAHLWLTSQENWSRYSNENRIYQEFGATHAFGRLNSLFRIRNEQRFFNTVQEGEPNGENRFINRFRLLLSLGIPLAQNGKTQVVIADEIHLNFGKDVVYNTFNQNRLTLGIKQQLSKQWSFDLGYMMVFQQLLTGYQYNLNHTLRLFFYGRFDFRKDSGLNRVPFQHAEE